jgi:hypothetical protein
MLVLLPDVVLFREIDQVHHGFGGKKEKRIDDFNLDKKEPAMSASLNSTLPMHVCIGFVLSELEILLISKSKSWD